MEKDPPAPHPSQARGGPLHGGHQSLLELPVTRLDGAATTFGELTGGRPALVVNVASRCGLTPL